MFVDFSIWKRSIFGLLLSRESVIIKNVLPRGVQEYLVGDLL